MSEKLPSGKEIRLTSYSRCAGWASKLNAETLAQVLRPVKNLFNSDDYPDLLVGLNDPDDAAIWQLDEDRVTKEFIDQEFKLKKGDIVYMFSDGYPDQFGGPLGRKFKMVRLKNLLRDIHDKPMDEQYNYIKSNFFLWKEDLDQVDDVLFMGVKI